MSFPSEDIFCLWFCNKIWFITMTSQNTSLTNVYSSVYSGADQRKHHSSTSRAFVRGIHRRPVNSPHKGPVTRKMFPFDDVIMWWGTYAYTSYTGTYTSRSMIIRSEIASVTWLCAHPNERSSADKIGLESRIIITYVTLP